MRVTTPWAVLALFALANLAPACGGRQVPEHDGYRSGTSQPWEKPEPLEFDADREVEFDGELSYPRRRRARWFALALPGDGEIDLQLSYYPIGASADREASGAGEPIDVAFEVYDQRHRRLIRADKSEDDAGERTKRRTLYELAEGRYLVHVYLQERLDEVEYTLRAQFRGGSVESSTDFPRGVAFLPELPAVPEVDDSPPTPRCRGRRCGRPRANRGPRRPRRPSQDKPPADDVVAVPEDGMRARVIGVRATDAGTRITINRGSAHGVSKGWSGRVVTARGKGIPNGGFKVTQVKAQECYATVRATPDAVTSAANVVIKP